MFIKLVIVSATAAMLAATSVASAQVLRDDPPGSAFQTRGSINDTGFATEAEMNGQSPGSAYAAGAPVRQERASTRARARSRQNATRGSNDAQ
jgi:hypothetical protein